MSSMGCVWIFSGTAQCRVLIGHFAQLKTQWAMVVILFECREIRTEGHNSTTFRVLILLSGSQCCRIKTNADSFTLLLNFGYSVPNLQKLKPWKIFSMTSRITQRQQEPRRTQVRFVFLNLSLLCQNNLSWFKTQ